MSIIKTDYVLENTGCFPTNNSYLLLNQKLCKLRLLSGGKTAVKKWWLISFTKCLEFSYLISV